MSETDFLLNQLDLNSAQTLATAIAMQKKAASVGFDWPDIDGVIAKIQEELDELKQEVHAQADKDCIMAELGDLLFASCNLARHLDIDPERALSHCNQKFYRRFNFVETRVSAEGKQFSDYSLEQLDSFWNEAKLLEQGEDP